MVRPSDTMLLHKPHPRIQDLISVLVQVIFHRYRQPSIQKDIWFLSWHRYENRSKVCVLQFDFVTLFFQYHLSQVTHGNTFQPIGIGYFYFLFIYVEFVQETSKSRADNTIPTNLYILIFVSFLFLVLSCFSSCHALVIRSKMIAKITTAIPPSNPKSDFHLGNTFQDDFP